MTDHTPSDAAFGPDDPIVAAWNRQGDTRPSRSSSDPLALADSIAAGHRKDQRRLFWLNVREVLPSLVVAGACAFSAPGSVRPLAVLAAAGLVLGVGCFLAASSIRQHRADGRWGSSVRQQLARRLAQLEHAAWLLRNVGWWYFLPFTLAIGLFYVGNGGGIPTGGDLVFVAVVGPLLLVAYWVNRRIGRTRYEEEVGRLESLLKEFDRTV